MVSHGFHMVTAFTFLLIFSGARQLFPLWPGSMTMTFPASGRAAADAGLAAIAAPAAGAAGLSRLRSGAGDAVLPPSVNAPAVPGAAVSPPQATAPAVTRPRAAAASARLITLGSLPIGL